MVVAMEKPRLPGAFFRTLAPCFGAVLIRYHMGILLNRRESQRLALPANSAIIGASSNDRTTSCLLKACALNLATGR